MSTTLRHDLSFSQSEMQAYLDELFHRQGLNAALTALFDWSLTVGYITPAKLNDNKRYTYFDAETGVNFKTQINIARSLYSPKPLEGKNIPKLHCPICIENQTLTGKEDLRVFEFVLSLGRNFFVQLTPFPLFPYHFVLIARDTVPMIMERQSIEDLMQFITLAPGFVGCSNSDVEWAGASVLVHHHYQVFKDLHLPIMEAKWVEKCHSRLGGNLAFGLLNFPIACCKLVTSFTETLIELGGKIIQQWKQKDPGRNTCNLILRKTGDEYELYVIFRNPDFRTPPTLTLIKSEGVGIIEVAGEGIYPVPNGSSAEKVWHEIESNGLGVIKGIIEGNNPIKREQFTQRFTEIREVVDSPT
jgi:UDPglucose--hexose-1-phosphate uridylyltransferase